MRTSHLLASFCCVAACLLPWRTAAQAETAEPAADPVAQYVSVVVIPLHEAGNVHEGASALTEMLVARLGARFEDVEFLLADAEEIEPAEWPVLPAEAINIGNDLGVDALLDGAFGGVEIVGGTWPNKGSDVPQARGRLNWRLLDCATGQLVLAGVAGAKRPQVYSPRIRSSEELARRVMQDLVTDVGDALEEAVVLAGTGESEAESGLPDATSTAEQRS
jgi:hypothetical protein